MVDRVVTKQLAGAEDLLLSLGTQVQARGSGNRTMSGINASHMLIDDLASIFAATQVNTALQEAMAAILVNAAVIALQQSTINAISEDSFNGSFEEADSVDSTLPADWVITKDAGGAIALDTTSVNNGDQALKFTSTGTGGGEAESKYLLVSPGDNIGLAWDMISDVVDVRNDVEIDWYDKALSLLSTSSLYSDSATNPTSWTRKEGSATAPATAVYFKIKLIGCNSVDITVGNTRFDGVRLLPKALQTQVDAGTVVDLFVSPETLAAFPNITKDIYVNESGGRALFNTGGFDYISEIVESSWESIGPTDSGADNIWTALNGVPTDADWIEVRVSAWAYDGTISSDRIFAVHATTETYGGGAGSSTEVAKMGAYCDSAGNGSAAMSVTIKIPLILAVFQMTYVSGFTTDSGSLYLVGYGYNSE